MPNFNDSMKAKVSPAAINTGLARPAGTGSTNDLLYTLWGGAAGSINDRGNAYFNTPYAPTALVGTAGDTTASIAFTAGSAGGSAITNYEFSTNNGSTFTARSPVSTASPLVISGLTNSTPYQIKLRAVNAFGAGTASSAVSVTPVGGYTQPTFRSSSFVESATTNWTINAPAGTSEGDILVMVVAIYIDFKSGVYGSLASSGWTERVNRKLQYDMFDYQRFYVYTKTAGASETSYSWTGGANWGGINSVAVMSIAGGTAVDVVGASSLGSTAATAIGASITTTASPELLVLASGSVGMSYIAASPMTTRIKNTTGVQGGIFAATQTLNAAGATGNRSFTSYGDGYPASSVLLSVK